MEIKDVFSQRLRALRDEIGISQEDLAKALGMARATISYYEGGHRTPDIAFLDTLCEKTGCSLDYLMGRSENMRPMNSDLGLRTELSDRSIEVLEAIADKEIMNFVIEHPKFQHLIRFIRILSYHIPKQEAAVLDENYRDFKLYQAAQVIREMADDAYNDDGLAGNPFSSATIKGLENNSYAVDENRVGVEMRKIAIGDLHIEGKLNDSLQLLKEQRLMKSPEAEAEDDRKIMEQEAARAATDPIYRFYRRMNGYRDDEAHS